MQRDGNKMLANHGEDSFTLPAGTYKVTATQDDGKGGMRTSTGSITILPYPVNVDLPVGPVSKGGKESEND